MSAAAEPLDEVDGVPHGDLALDAVSILVSCRSVANEDYRRAQTRFG
jgi:hypothetical protein